MKKIKFIVILIFSSFFGNLVFCQESGTIGESPYEFTAEIWMKPFAQDGFTWGGNSGVQVDSDNRIFFLQRGETKLPYPLPAEYNNFPGSLGIPEWNVLQGRGRVWQNCIYVINGKGEVIEVWNQWDHLFAGTDGPGPHRIRINPYDPEKRIWVIDETGHIIYVFSNDGKNLLKTLGEKNVSGMDKTHFSQPQDVAFLPNGTFLIADGLGNKRIVVHNADGSYHSEFGEEGTAPHQFGSVHSLALGPGETLYALDRNNRNIKIFRQTAEPNTKAYPIYEYVKTWHGLALPLDITVSENYAWVTDLNPPKIVQFNLDGSKEYTWHLPTTGPNFWIEMHSLSIDSKGNLYGTDNQAGRPQKLEPKSDANPDHIIRKPYVAL